MASLRDAVKVYQDELRAGIAWIAFWREGRSWSSDYIYLEMDDTLTPEDRSRLQEIRQADPAAVVLNGYYCGYLGEDMNLAELTAGVRRHYENGYNNIADFIEAHDDTLSPEQIEEARAAAHAAGLPFSEKPYREGDFDPYVFDGSMSAEDYDLMHRMMNEERSERLSEVFSILIDSRSRFEAGELSSAWLSLPTTAEQLHAAMQSVGITADNPQDFFINGYSYPIDKPLALPYDMVCAAGIDELNFLAARLEALAPADLDELNAAAQRRPGFDNIGQIIDYTYNLDFFVHIPEVQTVRDLGDYYLNKSGMVDMPEDWKQGIDLTAFGRNAAQHERGSFTPYGYIVESGDNVLCCDHCISSFIMNSPCWEARRLSSSHADLWTLLWCLIGSLKPTTLSPGMGLQQSAITKSGASPPSFRSDFFSSVAPLSSVSSSLSLMNKVQNFSILLFELVLTIFSRLSSDTIPAPILVYSSSLLLLS